MTDLPDITPLHEPISLAREMVERAPDCVAGLSVLVRQDGTMWFDMAGHQRKDLLWALHMMIHNLMSENIGD